MSLTKRKIHEVDENYSHDLLQAISNLYKDLLDISGLIKVTPSSMYESETLGDLQVASNHLSSMVDIVKEEQILKEEPQE